MAPGPIRRKTEQAVRDRSGNPVGLLYDEANDKTIMHRGDAEGASKTIGTAKTCPNNSTSAQLDPAGKFTGTPGDINGYAVLMVTIYSDQPSATDGLKVFFSHSDDPYDWHIADEYTYVGESYKTYSFQPVDQYFKIEYTNGGTITTELHISARLHSSNVKGSSHRMADDIKGQDDAELVKAILAAEKAGSVDDLYTNIQATAAGNLKVSAEEFDPAAILYQNRPYLENELEGVWYAQEMDGGSGAGTAIEEEHHKAHVGMHFNVHSYADLAINNVLDLQWVMNNWAVTTEEVHWIWTIKTEAETLWEIWEGATIVNVGTVVTPINNQRNSANTSVTTLYSQNNTSLSNANVDTSVAAATLLATGISGAGRDAGEVTRGAELIMKNNTTYCLRAIASAAGYVNFKMEWYEHVPHVANNWINSPLGAV